jgi:Putative transposase of IS4/5 family (DUF4096)
MRGQTEVAAAPDIMDYFAPFFLDFSRSTTSPCSWFRTHTDSVLNDATRTSYYRRELMPLHNTRELTDGQWTLLDALIPEPPRRRDGRRGRPWKGRRGVLNGILWVLRTGAPSKLGRSRSSALMASTVFCTLSGAPACKRQLSLQCGSA